jgi:hypothetical protein
LLPQAVVARVVDAVKRDLRDGTWDARYGHLRPLDEYDAGYRLIGRTRPEDYSGR